MTDPERNPTTAESSSPAAASGLLSSSSPTDPLLSPSAAASSSSLSAPEKDDEPPAPTPGQTSAVPDGKVHLTILLVSGRRKTFEFGPAETIAGVKKTVFEGWPKEWADETPASISSLKVVYLGRFLENDTTLQSNKIQAGQTTIVHLTIKNVQTYDAEDPKADSAPRCKLCIIV